jgi:penicillin-binding protein 1A
MSFITRIQGPSWKKIFLTLGLFLILSAAFIVYIVQDLAALKNLEQVKPALSTQVYSKDGVLIHQYFTHNRVYVDYSQFPESLVEALVATEDAAFWDHWGIHLKGILRALIVDIASMKFTQGSSTITMQLARNLYNEIGSRKNLLRKIKEMITALEIARHYSKEEIIEMYLNVSFFGHNYYGIESASENYFNKSVSELEPQEAAMLVGLLKSPNYYTPYRHPEQAKKRRNTVIQRMATVGYISQSRADTLKAAPLVVEKSQHVSTAPYFAEYIRRQLNRMQDSLGVNIYEDGLTIYTTLDTRIQSAMDSSIYYNIGRIQERVRNQKKLQRMREEMEQDSSIKVDRDSLFLAKTTVQIGMLAISPKTGEILAMVGGRDFDRYKFNHVTQAPRQPGSAFKPFLYTTAIENGYLPTHTELNQPVVLTNDDGTRWTPENYDHSVGGPTSLREGLRRSLNLIAIRLIQRVGPRNVVNTARRFGITTRLRAVPALALGTSEVYLMELVSAYTVFANHGIRITPYGIEKIEDRFGSVIYSSRSHRDEVLRESTTFVMNTLLQNVVNAGTGYRLRSVYHLPYSLSIGGKTGTTADFTDAWFMGFTPDVTVGTWVGIDNPGIKLGPGMSGASAALPFVGDFLSTIYKEQKIFEPSEFEFPENDCVKQVICKESLEIATPYCPETYEEVFDIRFQPKETCHIHTKSRIIRKRSGRGF